jgi:sugar-specific transcriptional regulator TrmB
VNIDQVANQIEALGLEETEAEVYLRLLQAGPAKVSQLASFVEMSRSTLYRTLDDLVEKGFVTKSLGRPTVYGPKDPETVFEMGAQDLRNQLDHLDHVRNRVINDLKTLHGDETANNRYHWKRLEGATRIYNIIHKLVQEAESRVEVVSNDDMCERTSLPFVERAWSILQDRAQQVDVRLVLDPSSSLPSDVTPENLDIRQLGANDPLHFLLVDRSELLLVVHPAGRPDAGSEDQVAIWTDAAGILTTHAELLDRMWPDAKPLRPSVTSG